MPFFAVGSRLLGWWGDNVVLVAATANFVRVLFFLFVFVLPTEQFSRGVTPRGVRECTGERRPVLQAARRACVGVGSDWENRLGLRG